MVKIEGILMSGEQVIKNQNRITFETGLGPAGDLYLTNMRLIFLNRKSWGLISPGALLGTDIQIPLQSIKTVSKGNLGSIDVHADKKYIFIVSMFRNSDWVDAIQQAMRAVQQPPYQPPYQQPQQPSPQQYPQTPFQQPQYRPPPPPPNAGRFCANCGRPLEFIQQYNRWYCHTCQKYA